MTAVITRLLIINNNLNFAVKMKQALERVGGFEVSSFTSVDTALDHLDNRPHDVVLLDFNLPGIPTMDVILRLRAIRPDIAIILSPDLPEVADLVWDMKLNGIINVPCTVREIIPVIEKARAQANDALPDTAEAPAMTNESDTLTLEKKTVSPPSPIPGFSSLGNVIIHTGGLGSELGGETLDVDMSGAEYAEGKPHAKTIEFVLTGDLNALRSLPAPKENIDALKLHQKLAIDEPPIPTFEQIGSVGELHAGIADADLEEVAEAIRHDQLWQSEQAEPMIHDDPIAAHILLESTREEHAGAVSDSDSLQNLLESIIRQFPEEAEGIKPLPSWVQDLQHYVREPAFLEDSLPEFEQTDRSNIQTTRMAHMDELESQPGELVTDQIAHGLFPSPPEIIIEPIQDDESATAATEDETEQDVPLEEHRPTPEAPQTEEPPSPLAQLALSLTQASLDLTADATLLARGREIIAYAGNMPIEDVEELRDGIENDWDAKPGESRIRFVNLPLSGQDYLLYSRRTEENLTLSLIFTSNTPLRVIRQQCNRLIQALGTVPEVTRDHDKSLLDELQEKEAIKKLEELAIAQEESAQQSSTQLQIDQAAIAEELGEPPPDPIPTTLAIASATTPDSERLDFPRPAPYTGPLTTQTYLWMTRAGAAPLDTGISRSIQAELDRQLTLMGWDVNDLCVAEDYVYILADVPAEKPTHEIVTELKTRSATIAQKVNTSLDPETLWNDSYAVLTPGREMDTEEIQQFINFSREN